MTFREQVLYTVLFISFGIETSESNDAKRPCIKVAVHHSKEICLGNWNSTVQWKTCHYINLNQSLIEDFGICSLLFDENSNGTWKGGYGPIVHYRMVTKLDQICEEEEQGNDVKDVKCQMSSVKMKRMTIISCYCHEFTQHIQLSCPSV
ncbi:hypothetical protein CHS0354_007387 [Potamilus streckersoni]|uniref:Uncharacterized protein n=1 Tax=Potamilus streckersoni TaxID=2493646 RepID=A0AAE0TFF7_9BIVA|nr:hypothetical protein CHS0354_007387 [Potamilus streckersoni]